MKKVKVAIIGLGKMGLLHSSILNTIPNVEIVALCDKSFILRKLVQKLFRFSQVVDDAEKLAGLDVNSVYVTTPIAGHYPIVKSLLSQHIGRNIFVEKTLTSSWDKSKQLCELARSNEGTNMVGYMKRFAVTFLKAKSMLAEDILGELISFDAYAYSSDFSKVQLGSMKSAPRGGVLSDLGSHVIDLALWFIGDFEVESASSQSIVSEGSEDSVSFKVKKPGLEGTFHVSWCMDDYRMPNFGLSITGKAGTINVNDYSVDLKLRNGDSNSWLRHDLNDHVGFLIGESEYYREDKAFVDSIMDDAEVEPSFVTASRVDYVIDQVKREAKIDVA